MGLGLGFSSWIGESPIGVTSFFPALKDKYANIAFQSVVNLTIVCLIKCAQ
jgi:hypothetical protein